jgi:hypothetical protein
MSYSQKYTLVQFFQQVDEDEVFHMTDWPLHITLADVFAINITTGLMNDLTEYLGTYPYAITHIKSEDTLGTTEVWLLENTPELQTMHDTLVNILEKHGAVFNTPEFTHGGFIPHITKQPDSGMKIGSKISVDVVSLVDMFPDQDWQNRKVIKLFKPESK